MTAIMSFLVLNGIFEYVPDGAEKDIREDKTHIHTQTDRQTHRQRERERERDLETTDDALGSRR